MAFLPDSKTGKKTLPPPCTFYPRCQNRRQSLRLSQRAGMADSRLSRAVGDLAHNGWNAQLRIHDLRHSYASLLAAVARRCW
jgi:hypothetical protein